MRVFIITRGYPHKGSINGIFEFDQAIALKKQGVEVVYLALDCRSFRRIRRFGRVSFVSKGVPVEELNIPIYGLFSGSKLIYIGAKAMSGLFSDCVNKYGMPDVIHSHFFTYTCMAFRAFEDENIPLIATEHYSRIHTGELSDFERDQALYVYPRLDKLIVVSNSLKERIKRDYGVVPVYIPNIVDLNLFAKKNSYKRIRGRIISVGRLAKVKRMDLLIQCYNEVHRICPNTELVIYGDGSERNKLERMIDDLNLNDNIVLRGFQDREVIAEDMNQSDFFVSLSESETFGVVFIEAMAAGLPILTTKCGGPESFVNTSQGILVDKDDKQEIINKMIYLCRNSELFNRAEITKYAVSSFSGESVSEQIIGLYNEII